MKERKTRLKAAELGTVAMFVQIVQPIPNMLIEMRGYRVTYSK